ncbi:MAG: hypothetical protein KME29_17290 [Calothrix sp. FI2-JRJ7]|jgi:hypothetical protein|nr:hypothetical protein [Calothrix sp. FI2-JRJ7]
MAPAKIALKTTENQVKTRLLLSLWDLGGATREVKRGELTKRIVSKGKKVADYQEVIAQLEKEGVLVSSKNGYSLVAPKGLEALSEGLKSAALKFEGTTVPTWTANALLKWISENNSVVATASAPVVNSSNNAKKGEIKSYDNFKKVALEVYEQLNRDYNLDNLVPIYRIRRTIGEQITREQFNEWMLDMQAEDILQLQGGSLPDNDPAKLEDSITTQVSGLRCYAKLLK